MPKRAHDHDRPIFPQTHLPHSLVLRLPEIKKPQSPVLFAGPETQIEGSGNHHTVARHQKIAAPNRGQPQKLRVPQLPQGGVTAAVAANVELRLIANHGNWRSTAIYAYISDSLEKKLSVSKAPFG